MGIHVGAWQSEGDAYTPEMYADLITARLSTETGATTMYAIGGQKRGLNESVSGIDVVLSQRGFRVVATGGTPIDSPGARARTGLL
jgi:hypothetical protein